MAETNLVFSKIVATPTPTAWSQAYSAGKLFAALSLETQTIPQTEEEHLSLAGKDLISTLESEFFTLENKDLESIKQAILTTISRIKEGVSISFVICFLSDNVLYLFAAGGGKAILKRGDKIGIVIEGEENGTNIKSVSGNVAEEDIIVLQTKSFQRIISPPILASSLDNGNPDEISEKLAPFVHEKAEGGASSVILVYKKETGDIPAVSEELPETIPDNVHSEHDENQQEKDEVKTEPEDNTNVPPVPEEAIPPFLTDQSFRKKPSINLNLGFLKRFPAMIPGNLSHSRKIILTIAVILIVLILTVSILALKNQKSSISKEQFNQIFTEAKTKFDEGINLKDLNASLSLESFKKSQSILEKNKNTFPDGSEEDKKIEELLTKVNGQITTGSEKGNTNAAEVDKSESKILSYEIDNPSAMYFTQNKDFVYFTDGAGVSKIDKGNNTKEKIIDKSWKTEGGIGVFGSNIYVLDKSNGILKFVPSEDKYSENKYFSKDAPDLGSAQAIGIDGSIYILFNDGSIQKYTKGAKDDFEISGIDKNMSSPTKIFTNDDFDNIYILDNGNSRIVVLDKKGKFIASYQTGVIKTAKDIDVNEEEKKIFILSSSKVYKIDIK